MNCLKCKLGQNKAEAASKVLQGSKQPFMPVFLVSMSDHKAHWTSGKSSTRKEAIDALSL
jgi:6-phosphogluconolactonase/glucosamine-6-phosphate isomerase/deaminase